MEIIKRIVMVLNFIEEIDGFEKNPKADQCGDN